MSDRVIDVAREFTVSPGGRYRRDGLYSGEEFREAFLVPAVSDAIRDRRKVFVELDGTFGYAASFLDEAFGGLIREHGIKFDDLKDVLRIVAEAPNFMLYKRLAEQYIREAAAQRKSVKSA